jgi:hypothetical protein
MESFSTKHPTVSQTNALATQYCCFERCACIALQASVLYLAHLLADDDASCIFAAYTMHCKPQEVDRWHQPASLWKLCWTLQHHDCWAPTIPAAIVSSCIKTAEDRFVSSPHWCWAPSISMAMCKV